MNIVVDAANIPQISLVLQVVYTVWDGNLLIGIRILGHAITSTCQKCVKSLNLEEKNPPEKPNSTN